MNMDRRNFVTLLGTASVLLLPGIAAAAEGNDANGAAATEAALRIEKSIRANFGGGFKVLSHRRSGGQTVADIEHLGNRFVVTSPDLVDWKYVSSDKSL